MRGEMKRQRMLEYLEAVPLGPAALCIRPAGRCGHGLVEIVAGDSILVSQQFGNKAGCAVIGGGGYREGDALRSP